MPAQCVVPVDAAVTVIKKYLAYFITDTLPPWNSPIWKTIADDPGISKYKWSKESVRTNIKNNRRNILTIAREECGYFIEHKLNDKLDGDDHNIDDESDESDNDDDDKNDKDFVPKLYVKERPDLDCFHVVIERSLWDHIKHIPDQEKEDSQVDTNVKLRNRVWTDILSFELWRQYRLKCAFVFKKAAIQRNGGYYATMEGRCKSKACRNPIFGFIETDPGDKGSVTVRFQCRDTRLAQHEDCKRPLQSERREELRKEVKYKGVQGYINQAANDLLKPGDSQCPVLFSQNVLYQLKKESTDQDFGVRPEDKRDLIKTIQNINNDSVYLNSILQVGDTPFFIFYMSPSQLHCYSEYRRINRRDSSISIDATGGVVRQFLDSKNEKTSYIFLYTIVINFNGSSQSIYQMLSEMHDTDHIYLWLTRWIRTKITAPKEIVCDEARALLNATCLAFNGYTLSNYIRLCFKNAQSSTPSKFIKSYIRIDTAHFMHTISTWDCWKLVVHYSVKSFYLYCTGLLIDCNDFQAFERLATLILIVSNVEYEDSIVNYNNELITPLEARKTLEELIIKGKTKDFIDDIQEKIDNFEVDIDKSNLLNKDQDIEIVEEDPMSIWVKKVESYSLNVIITGKKLNCFYVPKLPPPLKDKLKEFPLWSRVSIKYTILRATSSYVEQTFKDLKAVLKKVISLPARVDIFLKAHLRMIIGGVKLFQSKLLKFIDDNINFPEEVQSEVIIEDADDEDNGCKVNDETCYENWRGYGNDPKHHQFNWMFSDNSSTANEDAKNPTDGVSQKINELDRNVDEKIPNFSDWDENKENELYKLHREENDNITISPNDSIEQDHNYTRKSNSPFNNVKTKNLDNAVRNLSKKRKNEGKYFKSCPDMKLINDGVKNKKNSKTTQKKKVTQHKKIKILANNLLLNGNRSGPVISEDQCWFAYNTCPFDSIVQVIFNAGLENQGFRDFIKNSSNSTFTFVDNFLSSGLTSETCEKIYSQRFNILYPIYKAIKKTQMKEGTFDQNKKKENSTVTYVSRVIDCQDNVNNLWTKLFASEPSAFESKLCSSPVCEGNDRRNTPILKIYTIFKKYTKF